MGVIEQAVTAELALMPESAQRSVMATVALDLGKRLDNEPADTAAVLLARELRASMAELHRLAGGEVKSEIDRFLEGIATPSFGNTAHGA